MTEVLSVVGIILLVTLDKHGTGVRHLAPGILGCPMLLGAIAGAVLGFLRQERKASTMTKVGAAIKSAGYLALVTGFAYGILTYLRVS